MGFEVCHPYVRYENKVDGCCFWCGSKNTIHRLEAVLRVNIPPLNDVRIHIFHFISVLLLFGVQLSEVSTEVSICFTFFRNTHLQQL